MSTTKISGKFIEITGFSEDWTWSDYPQLNNDGLDILSILFLSSTVGDNIVCKEGSDTGPGFTIPGPVANQTQHLPLYGARMKLVIDYSESTVAGTEKITIIMK